MWTKIISAIVGIVVLIGALNKVVVTSWELEASEKALATTVEHVEEQHALDIAAIVDASKKARIENMEQQIYELDEEIRFGDLTVPVKSFKVTRRADLALKKQNIIEGIE